MKKFKHDGAVIYDKDGFPNCCYCSFCLNIKKDGLGCSIPIEARWLKNCTRRLDDEYSSAGESRNCFFYIYDEKRHKKLYTDMKNTLNTFGFPKR